MKWVCDNCSYSLELDDSQVISACPNCGQPVYSQFDDAVEDSPPVPYAEEEENATYFQTDAKNDYSEAYAQEATEQCLEQEQVISQCPVCCGQITSDDDNIICCPDCKTFYHRECWEDNLGCAVYGCNSSQCIAIHSQRAENEIECAWCHTILPPEAIICPICQRNVDGTGAAPSSFNSDKIKNNVLFPIRDNLIDLGNDIVRYWKIISPYLLKILSYYKNTLCQYVNFHGVASRKEYFSFILISSIIYTILILIPENIYLLLIYSIATLAPTIGLIIRRLHDTNLSGWFAFAIPILPILLCVPTKTKTE